MVTPGDVLAYRVLWDPYVMGTARAAKAAGDEWTKAAEGQTSKADLSIFAAPPDVATLKLYAQSEYTNADSIVSDWNAHAGSSDQTIVLEAAAFLQDFQNVVQRVAQVYQPQIAREVPSLPLPTPPSASAQKAVIARVEGLGILAKGVLHLIGVAAEGAPGAVAQAAASAATKAARGALRSPWVWAAAAGAGLLAVVGIKAAAGGGRAYLRASSGGLL